MCKNLVLGWDWVSKATAIIMPQILPMGQHIASSYKLKNILFRFNSMMIGISNIEWSFRYWMVCHDHWAPICTFCMYYSIVQEERVNGASCLYLYHTCDNDII